jgi:hypothetical protein
VLAFGFARLTYSLTGEEEEELWKVEVKASFISLLNN